MFGVWFLSIRGEIYATRQRAGTLFACFRSAVKVLAPSLNFADAVKNGQLMWKVRSRLRVGMKSLPSPQDLYKSGRERALSSENPNAHIQGSVVPAINTQRTMTMVSQGGESWLD